MDVLDHDEGPSRREARADIIVNALATGLSYEKIADWPVVQVAWLSRWAPRSQEIMVARTVQLQMTALKG